MGTSVSTVLFWIGMKEFLRMQLPSRRIGDKRNSSISSVHNIFITIFISSMLDISSSIIISSTSIIGFARSEDYV